MVTLKKCEGLRVNDRVRVLMGVLRDKNTSMAQFRLTSHQLALILAHEIGNRLPKSQKAITTPLGVSFEVPYVAEPLMLVPVLRSGLALLPAFLEFFPTASVGVVGLKRNEETAVAHWYYKNMPPLNPDHTVIILDPMLATGGTALEVLRELKNMGVVQQRIFFASIISAQSGIAIVKNLYPDVTLVTAACDPKLNDKKYIVPGLGDFGDRYFGTV